MTDEKLRQVFGLPNRATFECEYQPMGCDNLGSDMVCHRYDDWGDGQCPGEEAEEDEERE